MASVWDGILPARPDYGKEQNLRDIVRLTPEEEAQNAREDASPGNLRQLDDEISRFGDPTGALATERARLTGGGVMRVSNNVPQKSVWDGVLQEPRRPAAQKSVWDGVLPGPGIYVPRYEPEAPATPAADSRADLGIAKGAFAYANDFIINAGNQIFGVGKALSDFASPGNPVSKALDGLIEAGQSSQSDWQRQQNQSLADALQNADGEWDKVKIYFTHSIVNDPLKLLADAGGNIGPFWALGKSLQAANLSREAAQKITMGVAGAMGAGEVRGNIYAKIQAIPDADLQAESPEYADLRKTLTEAEAKHQFGSQFVKHLPEIAVTAVVGALGGKYGLEALAAGVGPKLGRLGSMALGAAEEGIQGAVEQVATNVGTRKLVPSQSLTEDVALNFAMEGLVGGFGGAAFSNRRQPETAPPVPGVAPRTGTVAPPTAPAAPAVPAFDIVTGKDTAVALPNGQQVGAQYIVMEASRLQTPVHPSGAVNPNYPAGMAGPIDLAAQQRIASEFVPDLVGDQEQASMGAPVIGADGIVEVGAKRAAALKGLYETEKGQTYKDWLLANAQRFGIADTAKVAEMRKPVLVRLRTAETDRAAFAQAARMTPRDVIRERADALRQKYSPLRPAVAPVAPQTQPVTQPVTAPTQSAKSDPNVVDPGRDDLFTAIAKLGGINYEAARAEWGLDPADWKRFPRPVFGKPVLHKSGGRSLDAMAEALHQLGYLDQQDLNELFDKFDRHLGGTPVYTPAGYEAQAAREAEERREEELRSPLATVDELAAADQETVSKVVDDLLAEFNGTEAMAALEEILERAAVETQDGSPADFDAAIMKRLKEVLDEDPRGQPAQEAGRADAKVRQEADSRADQGKTAAREEVDAAAHEAATSPRNDDRLPKGDEPAGERPGRAAKEKRSAAREASQAGGARFSRTITSDDDFSSTVLTILADVVDLYQQPKVEAKSMEDIAQAIDPGIKVTRIPAISKRMEKEWSFTMPDGKVADAWLYKDGAVVLDASRLVEGESRGSALYGILAAFAHNNGKRFIGDPSGLSDAALFRRTEHMIATAMKFGTTEHIYPHERQVAEGLKWDDKPGANNLKNLLDFSRQLMERELPEIADLRYNFESRQFETADGKPYRQADFDALAQSGGARKARAGSTTLKRAALLQSLVRATSPEARRGILGEVARQLREVLDPDLVETYYSRTTSPAVAGLSVSELEDVVSKVSTPGAKRITIVATEADLPAKVVARLRSEGVTGVRGMFDPKTDSIWLVAGNIMSPEEAAFVLMHEGVHRGLRVFFGNDLTPILQQIYDTNRSVALRADLYRAKHKIDLMEAIEEVLADMAQQGDASKLKGWDKLVAFIRKWVKELGDRLGVKLVFTDEMVEQLVSAASTAGLRGDVSVFDDMIAKAYRLSRAPTPDEAVATVGQAYGMTPEEVRENWGYSDERDYVDLAKSLPVQKATMVAPQQLTAAYRRWRRGDITDDQMLQRLDQEMARRKDRKLQGVKDKVRGPEWLHERLIRAKRTGELTEEQAEVALWMAREFPHLATDVAISIKTGGDNDPAGFYNVLSRLVRLFSANANADTAAHEILHHTERMMPTEVQDGIKKEWLRQLETAVSRAKERLAKPDAKPSWTSVETTTGDQQKQTVMLDWMLDVARAGDHGRALTLWKLGGLQSLIDYQYVNPSEFWAVNAARIMRERFESQGDWRAKAKQWLREFIAKVRSMLRLPSDAPVLKALQSVLDGDGAFLSKTMLANMETLADEPIPVAQQIKNAVQKRRGYKGAAQVIIDRIDRAITPLGGLSNASRYLKDRYQALGKIANADAIGKSLYDAFAKQTPETQQQVYEYLTTRDADENDIVDAKARESAVRAKQIIEQVGEQLVARGFLEPAVMEAHRGAYLPRLYLKHLLNDADSRAIGAGKKPSPMGYLKERNEGIPKFIREVIYGEIKDPGFLSAVGVTRAMRDMAILDWLAQISKEKEWIFPESMVEFEGREVSVLWLKAEADRIRQQIPYYTGTVKTKAEELVKRMDAVVTPHLAELQAVPEDFKQMPDSPRYGHLRGLYVRKEIYDDIVGVGAVVPKDAGFMEKLLGYGGWATKATQLWKASKVSLNPPGQIRNFLSNAVLLQLSGVPLHMVPVRLAQAANELRTNGRYAQIAKKHGVSVASFAAQELLHIERDFIDLKARMRGPWSLMNLVNIGAKIMDKAGNLYQWSESLYKTAKIIDEMEKGASESDAAIEAHKWLMDYSLVGPNVKYLRNAPVGIPFISFYAKLAPRLVEVALYHPQRFAPWAIMAYTLPMIIAAMGGPDREEQEKLKKLLPEFWQDKGHVYVLPYKDEHGRWQAIDISYLMPWTMFDTVARKTVQGDIKSAVEATGILGGPIPDIISAWKTGKDPFTGRDIVNPGDPQHLQWGSLLTYVYNLAMPPVITNRGLIGPDFGDPLHAIQGRLPSAVRGSTNKYGDTVSTVKQAAAGAAGFNTRSVNPNERALKLNRMRAEMNDVKDRLKRSLGDRAISSEERKRLLKTYADEIRRRQEKIKEFAQATQ